MLKWFSLLIGIAHAQSVAQPPSYLIYSNQALCLQRSQQQCAALGCDGVNTIYWWDCNTGPLQAGIVGPNAVPAGSYAMQIQVTGPFAATHIGPNAVPNGGLTATEQSKLVPAASIQSLLATSQTLP